MVSVLLWLDSALYDGLPFAIVTVAFLLTFRYLRFADLTTAGTFVLGGAVAAQLTVNVGVPAHLAMLLAAVAGILGGSVTALLITRFRVEPLLAGIVCAFALYSVNLLLVRPTLPYGSAATALTRLEAFDRGVGAGAWHPAAILYFALVLGSVKFLLDLFLGSEVGMALRAMEDAEAGETTLERLGVNARGVKWIVVALSNGLVAASGALISMKEGAANAYRGFDVVITGLVALVIGSRLLARVRFLKAMRPTTTAIGGSLLYFGIVGVSYRLEIPAEFTKLILAALVAFLVADTSRVRRPTSRSFVAGKIEVSPGAPAVELSGVDYRYPASEIDVLKNVSFSVEPGDIVLVRGENGSGKTTIAKLIAGVLEHPTKGSIKIAGMDLTNDPDSRRSCVAYVDQLARLGVVEFLTVEENLVLGRMPRRPRPWRRAMTRKVREELEVAFATADLDRALLSNAAQSLSGGQRQVVNLARIIVRPTVPAIVVADEPTNNLDQQNQSRVWALLRHLHARGSTIVVVAHGECPFEPTKVLLIDRDHRSVKVTGVPQSGVRREASPR
jgi:putative ABC transport system permease protein